MSMKKVLVGLLFVAAICFSGCRFSSEEEYNANKASAEVSGGGLVVVAPSAIPNTVGLYRVGVRSSNSIVAGLTTDNTLKIGDLVAISHVINKYAYGNWPTNSYNELDWVQKSVPLSKPPAEKQPVPIATH